MSTVGGRCFPSVGHTLHAFATRFGPNCDTNLSVRPTELNFTGWYFER